METKGKSEGSSSITFHFVTAGGNDARDEKRRARSHAVKQALQRKRQQQQASRDNFLESLYQKWTERDLEEQGRSHGYHPWSAPALGMLDPFQALAVDARKFQRLLHDGRARQASEPVFSVGAVSSFHSFPNVFRGGLDDPALGNAVMLMLTFAVGNDVINEECMRYQTLALGQIRQRVSSVDKATSLATFGAILFLAGVEARRGMRVQAEMHLRAIAQLLEIGRRKGISLTAGIKRAIFWQDLNASLLSGTERIVDHNTFVELRWQRDPFTTKNYDLPSGFRAIEGLLSDDFIAVLEDVRALLCLRKTRKPGESRDAEEIANVNNHQASIQSRLVGLTNLSPVLHCIRLAASLCTSMVCCRVWCGSVIPDSVAMRLLQHLQCHLEDPAWDDHVDLLRWVVFAGGSFGTAPGTRAGFLRLATEQLSHRFDSTYLDRLFLPEDELNDALDCFIWSEVAFDVCLKAFWDKLELREQGVDQSRTMASTR